MRRTLDALYLASGALAAICLFLILTVVGLQVGLNFVAAIIERVTGESTGFLLPSYADFAGYLLVAATFLAMPYAIRQGAHIRVTLAIQNLATAPRRLVELWCSGLGAVMAGYTAWFAAKLVHESYLYNDVAFGLIAVPLWIPQLPIPIGMGLMAFAFLDDFIVILGGGTPSYERHVGILEEIDAKSAAGDDR